MNSIKIHTPVGVKDYTSHELLSRKAAISKIENIFSSYSYEEVCPPTLEFLEVFENKGVTNTKDFYKFVDRDGEVLALRPDFTPPVSRIASTYFTNDELPLRFYYIGSTFKYIKNYQGKDREILQAGVELVGINDAKADYEVILLAIRSVLETGISDFKLDIGNVKFIDAVLESSSHTQVHKEKISKLLIKGDFVEYESFIKSLELCKEHEDFLIGIPMLIGDINLLREIKATLKIEKAVQVICQLEDIYEYLKLYNLHEFVRFDLGMIGKLNYYTGVIFHGYSNYVGYSIVNGGRYDNLIKEFGNDYPSVGFAININGLMEALKKINSNADTVKKNITLIMYNENGLENSIKVSDELRNSGMILETSLFGDDLNKNIAYGKNKGIGGILFFKDEDKIEIINLETDDIREVTIEELLEG